MKEKLINTTNRVIDYLASEDFSILATIVFYAFLLIMVGITVITTNNSNNYSGSVTCVREDIHGYVCN